MSDHRNQHPEERPRRLTHQPAPRRDDVGRRRPPHLAPRSQPLDDDAPPRGAPPSRRSQFGRDAERRRQVASDQRVGGEGRRAQRPSSSSAPGRDAQHRGQFGAVGGWDDPEPRANRGTRNRRDDSPRGWDDDEWQGERRPARERNTRRAPERNGQKSRATHRAGDDWGDNDWGDNDWGDNDWGDNDWDDNDWDDDDWDDHRRYQRNGQAEGLGRLWETSRQWAAHQGQRLLGTGKHATRRGGTSQQAVSKRRRVITLVVLACVLVCALGSGVTALVLYQQMNAMAHSGLQHIKNAEAELKKVQTNPFDAASIQAAQAEFAAANSDFSRVNARLNLIGAASLAPVVGSKVSGAQKLVPIAVEATQAGMLACDVLHTLATDLKSPFGTTGGGLTNAQYAIIQQKWAQIRPLAKTIIQQLGQLSPSDVSLDPRLGPIVGQFVDKLPQINQLLDDFDGVVAALPQLLGVEKPSAYLMLILDSSELRPTGGFIGNFGALKINKGQIDPGFHISDITLIDYCNKFGCNSGDQVIPIPDKYGWLRTIFAAGTNQTWSLRDSNLDPDYPTTAKYALDIYSQLLPGAQRQLGNSLKLYDPKTDGQFAGVVTLSLGFFQEALKITGSVTVDLAMDNGKKIHEVVTSDNFVSKIHYYALSSTGSTGGDNTTCGNTSCSKVFTSAVVQAFMAKIKSNISAYIGGLGKLFFDSLRTKDIEVFLSAPGAEQALIDLGIGATVQTPKTGDSVFQVDANIGANKDNAILQYKMSDQITIDESGAATHKMTWQYTWPNDPKTLAESFPAGGPDGNYNYHSYSRIFVPPSASYISQSGLTGFGQDVASKDTFDRKVFHGAAYAYFAKTTNYGVSWKTPGVVTHDDAGYHYTLLFQREAGIVWPLTLTINLPACATISGAPQTSGLTPLNLVTVKGTTVTVTGPLTQDEQFQIDYTCSSSSK